jgi:hypothetical protein
LSQRPSSSTHISLRTPRLFLSAPNLLAALSECYMSAPQDDLNADVIYAGMCWLREYAKTRERKQGVQALSDARSEPICEILIHDEEPATSRLPGRSLADKQSSQSR